MACTGADDKQNAAVARALCDRLGPCRVSGAVGGGFVGTLLRLDTPEWRGAGGGPPSALLKLPPSHELFRAEQCHEREVAFYAGMAPLLPRGLVPLCFGGGPRGLLLEDLSPAAPADFGRGMTLGQARAAVRAAARLHTALAASPDQARPRALRPEGEFPLALLDVAAVRRTFGEGVADTVARAAARAPAWLGAWRADRALPRTVVHGDLWGNNVLFDAGGGAARLVDFQFARTGCPLVDLAVLLHSSLDPPLLRAHERGLLAEYRRGLAGGAGAQWWPTEGALGDAWADGRAMAVALAVLCASADVFDAATAPRVARLAERVAAAGLA